MLKLAKANGQDIQDKLMKQEEKPKTLAQFIEHMKPEIQRALPKHMDADRIARIALTTLRSNPKLQSCDGRSFLAALMQSSQLGLEPNTPLGEAYIIPYGKEASFQVGYKGLLSLAHRTGEYRTIYAMEVYENDQFKYGYGLDPFLVHMPDDDPEGEPIAYYAVYHLVNGGKEFRVWTTAKVKKHAMQYSQAFQKGWTSPWKTDFDSMAKKTVLKDLLKFAPKSIEFARAISMDETVKKDIDADMSIVPAIDVDYSYPDAEKEIEQTKAETAATKEQEKPKDKPKSVFESKPKGNDEPDFGDIRPDEI